jgi:CRP-like cAMP-binding protein
MSRYVPLADIKSVLPVLSQVAIWNGFSGEQRQEMYRRLQVGSFKEGEYIFEKGDEPSYIYVVKSGRVDLFIGEGGIMLEKKTLSAGEVFGVASLMSMRRHNSTAVAVEDCEVMVLSRQALFELQSEDVGLFALLMMNIARELARRLKLTDDIFLEYAQTHKDWSRL